MRIATMTIASTRIAACRSLEDPCTGWRQTRGTGRSAAPRLSPATLRRLCLVLLATPVACVVLPSAGGGAEPAAAIDAATAWKTLPSYRHGQDLGPLLVLEREAIAAVGSDATRAAFAARLAAVLAQPDATADARQWACLKLRSVGTPAEVPILAEQLFSPEPETADAARQALESIPGDESVGALRAFLTSRRAPPEGGHVGLLRAGVVGSLAARRDAGSVPLFTALADDADPTTAAAALAALGRLGDPAAIAAIRRRAERAGVPTPPALVEPLARAAAAATRAGDRDAARSIHELLGRPAQSAAARQAGLTGLLDDAGDARQRTTLEWLRDADPAKRSVAAFALPRVDDAGLSKALETIADHEPSIRQAILSLAATRMPAAALPALLRAARDDAPQVRVTAIECLGQTGVADPIPVLIDALADEGEPARSARGSLQSLPRALVVPAVIRAIDARPELRPVLVEILGVVGDGSAIEPLAAVSRATDPAPWQAALESIRRIARPEAGDIGRLVDLFAAMEDDARREAVARMIVGVVKQPDAAAGAGEMVLTALAKNGLRPARALPLVGRMGGPTALAQVEAGLASDDPEVRDAAFVGLCNWPDASVADRLLAIAKDSLPVPERAAVGRRALHSYVRVITHKSFQAKNRLALIRDAMTLAADGPPEERGFIIERTAAAERSLDAVDWIAGYLDDPSVAQSACRAILELAHHRYLRQPNKARFDPILDRVAAVAADPAVADRARRYKMGL